MSGGGSRDEAVSGVDVWDLPDPLAAAGYDDAARTRLAPLLAAGGEPGRVVRIEYGGCHVVVAEGRRPATARVRPDPRGPTDLADTPLAVGDWVVVRREADGRHLVVAVAPRDGRLGRRDPSRELCEQVLAANVRAVLVVQALDRPFSAERQERAVALAREGGAAPILVAAKADLATAGAAAERHAAMEARAGACPVHVVDVRTGRGLAELQAALPAGTTAALLGESGAGKSSLANALHGRDVRAVGTVRARDAKGRHTTTARELVPLADGRALLDTPGTRELGLVHDTGGLDAAFADVVARAPGCRFADCDHDGTAGCAVAGAVAGGLLLDARRRSYVALRAELVALATRREQRAQRLGEGRDRRGLVSRPRS